MAEQPPIACTLGSSDLDTRLVTMRRLGEQALVGVRADDSRAVLQFRGETERIDALVAAESRCCAFFEFATTRNGAETDVEIRVPAGAEPMLRGFVAAIVAGWEGSLG